VEKIKCRSWRDAAIYYYARVLATIDHDGVDRWPELGLVDKEAYKRSAEMRLSFLDGGMDAHLR